MKIAFFTLRDFNETGGGGIRILSLINELSLLDVDVSLITASGRAEGLHPHVHIRQLDGTGLTRNKQWILLIPQQFIYFDKIDV